MARAYWLVKSEPDKYSWSDFKRDGSTYWDGVRNAEARNNLAAMRKGDLAFYYHSKKGKDVVGVARVTRESYPDPTTSDARWLVVDLAPVIALAEPVTLKRIKSEPTLSEIALVRKSRLSVVPLERTAFQRILKLAKTRIPRG